MPNFREIINNELIYYWHPGQKKTFATLTKFLTTGKPRFAAMLAGLAAAAPER